VTILSQLEADTTRGLRAFCVDLDPHGLPAYIDDSAHIPTGDPLRFIRLRELDPIPGCKRPLRLSINRDAF
jgi:hypothetical protein